MIAITEGELKADVATEVRLIVEPIFAVPGISQWPLAGPTIEQIRPTTVIIAFDEASDSERQRVIDKAKEEFAKYLEQRGITVEEYDIGEG